MNLTKVNYITIAMVGNLGLLKGKMKIKNDKIDDIKNLCDDTNMSLLLTSIAYLKFDIAKYLLENNVKVNVVSNNGYNELHCISPSINLDEGIEITKELIDRDVDLNLQDKKHKNTPFWLLCHYATTYNTDSAYELIEYCFTKKPDIDTKNAYGITIRDTILQEGNQRLIQMLKKYN